MSRLTAAPARRASAVQAIATLTRRLHPRGTERLLHYVHHPERRQDWSIVGTVRSDGFRLNVDTASYIEWCVFFTGAYEPEVARLIAKLIRDGHDAIDVGANVGVHTLRMARAAGVGVVLAVEPNPDTAARLRANLDLNGAANVIVEECALAASAGTAKLFVPKGANRGMSRLSSHGVGAVDELTVAVHCLDQLAHRHRLRQVDLIKVDVEGYEPQVLAGADQLLAAQRPALIFEYNRDLWADHGHSFDTVVARLVEIGYRAFFEIRRGGLRPVGKRPSRSQNIEVLATAD